MIECCNFNSRIVRGGEECVARTQTGAGNTEPLIALLLQPIQAAADVEDRLTAGVHGAPDVRGDRIVGAPNLRRPANIVIRHAQPQHRDSQPVQDSAQRIVVERIGIPVRQQYDRTFSFRRKPAGIS